jgi:plasmid stability protein
MAQLTVRDIPDETVDELKAAAQERGQSMNALVRAALEDYLQARRRARTLRDLLPEIDRRREAIRRRHGILSDSTEIIREFRDAE